MRENSVEVEPLATEYEWKFRVSRQAFSELIKEFSQGAEQIAMETTYYDTPTGALAARRYTLRKRMENGTPVCTLKAPAGDARGEWETVCDTIENAIPKLLTLGCPADLANLTREGLLTVCGAKFTRLAKQVALPEGAVEVALDEGILFGGGREMPLLEAEVELKSGETAVCDAFAKALADQYALTPEPRSKFARALALYRGE